MEMKRVFIEDEKNPVGHYLPDYLYNLIRYDQNSERWNRKEGIEDQIERTCKALGITLAMLNAKGLITDQEMIEMTGTYTKKGVSFRVVKDE